MNAHPSPTSRRLILVTMRVLLAVIALATGLAGFAPFVGSAHEQVQVPVPAPDVPQDPAAATVRKLQLTFDGAGNVTLIAQGVTLQEILAEWTRIGGCYFPNAERLPRAMMVPLQFENVPEIKVLDSLLRSAAGVVIAPRTARTVGASAYEVVHILPTSTATATSGYSPINTLPPPMPTMGSPDDEIPPVTPVMQQQRGAEPPPPPGNRQAAPTVGVPASGVFVPIQPVPSSPTTNAPGRGGTPPPPPPAGSAGS